VRFSEGPMIVRDIQTGLWLALRGTSQLVLPNFTPAAWFECDVFSVSKSGYMHEHEIKMSVADFRRDAEKADYFYERVDGRFAKQRKATKHERLLQADVRGPSCFWFVVPDGLIGKSDVPRWAGLKVVRDQGHWCSVRVVKMAPRLHNAQVSAKVIEQAETACYWRYWNERLAADRVRRSAALAV
jgi:hypothetical protein